MVGKLITKSRMEQHFTITSSADTRGFAVYIMISCCGKLFIVTHSSSLKGSIG